MVTRCKYEISGDSNSARKGNRLTSDSGITNRDGSLFNVGGDSNEEILSGVELGRVGEGGVSNLVESIGSVGDQFSKENVLIRGTKSSALHYEFVHACCEPCWSRKCLKRAIERISAELDYSEKEANALMIKSKSWAERRSRQSVRSSRSPSE